MDLRARRAFAAGHLAGALSFGLDGNFATYLGWLIPWGTPLTLLSETPAQVAEAQRELLRIGIDRPEAAATGHPAEWSDGHPLRSFPVADFAELRAVRHHRPVVILDVRRNQEWAESHIDGAVPLHELAGRLGEVPEGEVWVHCHGLPRRRHCLHPGRGGPDGRRRRRRVRPGRPGRLAAGRQGRVSGSRARSRAGGRPFSRPARRAGDRVLRDARGPGVLHPGRLVAASPHDAPLLGGGTAPDAGGLAHSQRPLKALSRDHAPSADGLRRRHLVPGRSRVAHREKPVGVHIRPTARRQTVPVIIHDDSSDNE